MLHRHVVDGQIVDILVEEDNVDLESNLTNFNVDP